VYSVERVQRRQSLGDILCQLQYLGDRQQLSLLPGVFQPVSEASTWRIFHHQNQRVAIGFEIVNLDDAQVIAEFGAKLRLQLKALPAALKIAAAHTGRVVAQHLERARRLKQQVLRAIHLTESPRANQALDAVFV